MTDDCSHDEGLELGLTFRCKDCHQILDEMGFNLADLPNNVEQVLKTIAAMKGIEHCEGKTVDELKEKYGVKRIQERKTGDNR